MTTNHGCSHLHCPSIPVRFFVFHGAADLYSHGHQVMVAFCDHCAQGKDGSNHVEGRYREITREEWIVKEVLES